MALPVLTPPNRLSLTAEHLGLCQWLCSTGYRLPAVIELCGGCGDNPVPLLVDSSSSSSYTLSFTSPSSSQQTPTTTDSLTASRSTDRLSRDWDSWGISSPSTPVSQLTHASPQTSGTVNLDIETTSQLPIDLLTHHTPSGADSQTEDVLQSNTTLKPDNPTVVYTQTVSNPSDDLTQKPDVVSIDMNWEGDTTPSASIGSIIDPPEINVPQNQSGSYSDFTESTTSHLWCTTSGTILDSLSGTSDVLSPTYPLINWLEVSGSDISLLTTTSELPSNTNPVGNRDDDQPPSQDPSLHTTFTLEPPCDYLVHPAAYHGVTPCSVQHFFEPRPCDIIGPPFIND